MTNIGTDILSQPTYHLRLSSLFETKLFCLLSTQRKSFTMHPKTCLLLLSIFVVKNIAAQPLIDSHLLHQMQNNSPSHFHKIRIEFQEQFDVSGAKMILNARNASNHERALTITQGLSETATRSQAGVRNYLADKQNQVKAIQPFWIANVIFCEAQTAAINGLLQFQEINGIFLENNRFELGEPSKRNMWTCVVPVALSPALKHAMCVHFGKWDTRAEVEKFLFTTPEFGQRIPQFRISSWATEPT